MFTMFITRLYLIGAIFCFFSATAMQQAERHLLLWSPEHTQFLSKAPFALASTRLSVLFSLAALDKQRLNLFLDSLGAFKNLEYLDLTNSGLTQLAPPNLFRVLHKVHAWSKLGKRRWVVDLQQNTFRQLPYNLFCQIVPRLGKFDSILISRTDFSDEQYALVHACFNDRISLIFPCCPKV